MIPFAKKINPVLLFTLILLLQTYLMVAKGYEKEFFHLDEVFTFILSNNKYGMDMPANYKNEWNPGSDYYNLLTTSADNTFNYKQVYKNQTNDVHPPLYYFIIHTITSFFPQQFSKWFGIIPNIFFFLCTQVFIFLLSERMLNSKYKALLPCLLYGFSLGAVSTVEFIRMYSMMTAIMMMALYMNCKIIHNAININRYITFLFIINILGYLTHYHHIIYSFFMCSFMIIYLNHNNPVRDTYKYIATNLISFILFILIYPAARTHIFSGQRGTEAFQNLTTTTFWDRLSLFYNIINGHMFCSLLTIIAFFFLLFYIIKKTVHYEKTNYGLTLSISVPSFSFPIVFFISQKTYGLLLILFTGIPSLFLIIKTAAYINFRYISPLYPLIAIVTAFVIFKISQKNIFLKIFFCLFSISILYSGIHFNYDNRYKKYQNFFHNYMDTENLIIANICGYNLCSVMLPITNTYKNIYIATKEHIDKLPEKIPDMLSKLSTSKITLCIINEYEYNLYNKEGHLTESLKLMENKLIDSLRNNYKISLRKIGYITSITIEDR